MATLELLTEKNDETEAKLSKLYELMSNQTTIINNLTSIVNEINALLLSLPQEYQESIEETE